MFVLKFAKGVLGILVLSFPPLFSPSRKIEQIFVEKPRGVAGRTMPYLCIKVRSKLIKPVLELPFTKVGNIIQDTDFVECNESGTAILRVKFTSRPRAVFHKHSDVMILLVSLRKGNETLCSSNKELIFRGGTGSIHSAEGRNGINNNTVTKKRKVVESFISLENNNSVTPDSMWPLIPPLHHSYPKEYIPDSLKTEPVPPPPSIPVSPLEPKIEPNSIGWSPDDFIDFGNSPPLYSEAVVDVYPGTENYLFESPEVVVCSVPNYTLVFGKRRGSCKVCLSECSFYRGPGGPCNECGCFPSQHIDLDKKS